jgi:hypothetical protein
MQLRMDFLYALFEVFYSFGGAARSSRRTSFRSSGIGPEPGLVSPVLAGGSGLEAIHVSSS